MRNLYAFNIMCNQLSSALMHTKFQEKILVILLIIAAVANWSELAPLPAGPWWIYTGGVVGVIYIAFSSTIVQHLGVLTFTLFSVGGQLVGSLLLDLLLPTSGVNVSAYLVTGIVMTYFGVIAGGVSNSRIRKPAKAQ